MSDLSVIESRRLEMQLALDAQKSHHARNKMGQFSTPFPLALDIMRRMSELCPRHDISFLEPAFGTGVFLSAFIEVYGHSPHRTLGFEIDQHYCNPSGTLWRDSGAELRCCDFLRQSPDMKFDVLITNPPYSRHHHIDPETKLRLQKDILTETGIKISGLAGLYCYFIMLSTKWLKAGGFSCWLIPCEFMDVNYGSSVKKYLLNNVELIQIHRFSPSESKFTDALVSSCIVIFKNQHPSADNNVIFSSGTNIHKPERLRRVMASSLSADAKWTRFFSCATADNTLNRGATLGDYFTVKRGIATGGNDFFILNEEEAKQRKIPDQFLRPVLPSPRYVKSNRIESKNGIPSLDRREFLFSCNLDEESLRRNWQDVWQYICEGRERGIANGYICSRRTPWYSCEKRESAPIVVPYMGRGSADGRLFRFILNESDAITTNVYLMLYPKKQFAKQLGDKSVLKAVWQSLNDIPPEKLVSGGRTYGGGLHKLEPNELMQLPATEYVQGFGRHIHQPSLF